MPPAIELTQLSKTYAKRGGPPLQAVADLNLTVPPGQVIGLLGPNGAGKTTTIKMICGLVEPTTGHARLNGFDVRRQRNMAMRQVGAVLEGTRNIYGFGFFVGGAALLFKQIGPLANMVQNMLLFLNGSFVPVARFPDWLAAVAYTLPTSQGIILLRRIILDDESLIVLWQDGSLLWLSVHSAVYLTIGLIVFTYAERLAKRRGLLGQY